MHREQKRCRIKYDTVKIIQTIHIWTDEGLAQQRNRRNRIYLIFAVLSNALPWVQCILVNNERRQPSPRVPTPLWHVGLQGPWGEAAVFLAMSRPLIPPVTSYTSYTTTLHTWYWHEDVIPSVCSTAISGIRCIVRGAVLSGLYSARWDALSTGSRIITHLLITVIFTKRPSNIH